VLRVTAHRSHGRSTQPLSVDDDQSPEVDTHEPPLGQRQASVVDVTAVMKETDVEEAEVDSLLHLNSRNDESGGVPSV
jgi:hypothetical protein